MFANTGESMYSSKENRKLDELMRREIALSSRNMLVNKHKLGWKSIKDDFPAPRGTQQLEYDERIDRLIKLNNGSIENAMDRSQQVYFSKAVQVHGNNPEWRMRVKAMLRWGVKNLM